MDIIESADLEPGTRLANAGLTISTAEPPIDEGPENRPVIEIEAIA